MKSLFLGLTFLLASFNGTSDVEKTVTEEFVCSNWATINPKCGNTYYLCTDSYGSFDDFIADVSYFNSVKC